MDHPRVKGGLSAVQRTGKTTFYDVSGGFDVQVADRPPGSSGPSARTQRRTGEAAGDKSGHGFGRGLFLKTSRSV